MSPFHECCLPAGLAWPEPFAVTRSDTCVIKYPDTVVDIVEPDLPPYSVIYPGPTLTTFPQQTVVGSTALLDIRKLLLAPQGSLGFGGRCALGSLGANAGLSSWGAGSSNRPFPPHLSRLFCCGTCRPT
ncbi:KRFJ protein, partial [Picathartes gymnocephalus]|nr:KRFJ protein [Picathartes gymnocephalus]